MISIKNPELFERLVREAEERSFIGWDFSYIANRYKSAPLSWNYQELVRAKIPLADSLLDMDTGGGEVLSSLQPLPPHTYALESYLPNVEIAKQRLESLNVHVVQFELHQALPFEDNMFDLIINRHGGLYAPEVYRILKPGGTLITQQVGGQTNRELNEHIAPDIPYPYADWDLASAVNQLRSAEFQILEQKEEFPEVRYYDIGAIAYQLKAVPWQIPGFSIDAYRKQLAQLHNIIQDEGSLLTHFHSFYIEATKEGG